MPVFEGLLPEPHNTHVLDILFALAHWHAMAKLRQHTDPSLVVLESVTVELGLLLRGFKDKTCAEYDTRELPREMAARMRQATQAIGKSTASNQTPNLGHGADVDGSGDKPSVTDDDIPASSSTSPPEARASKSTKSAGRLRKTLNLNTYKDHSLGDYVESIRRYGTTDSYSTEAVSLAWSLPAIQAESVADGTRAPISKVTLSADKP